MERTKSNATVPTTVTSMLFISLAGFFFYTQPLFWASVVCAHKEISKQFGNAALIDSIAEKSLFDNLFFSFFVARLFSFLDCIPHT